MAALEVWQGSEALDESQPAYFQHCGDDNSEFFTVPPDTRSRADSPADGKAWDSDAEIISALFESILGAWVALPHFFLCN